MPVPELEVLETQVQRGCLRQVGYVYSRPLFFSYVEKPGGTVPHLAPQQAQLLWGYTLDT